MVLTASLPKASAHEICPTGLSLSLAANCQNGCADQSNSDEPQIAAEGLSTFARALFDTSDFPPRWYCGTWHLEVGWIHVCSDFAIFAAYFAIPVILLGFVAGRQDISSTKPFILFSAFVLVCGLGYLLDAAMFWWPAYRFSGIVKLSIAIISWITVLNLLWVIPYALSLPGLASLNRLLEHEVKERREAQTRLQTSYDELHHFAKIAIDREERVIELKAEVNELLVALDRHPRYESPELKP